MRTINLPCYGIQISQRTSERCTATTCLAHGLREFLRIDDGTDHAERLAMIEGIEAMILGCCIAGVDIESPQFLRAIEEAVAAGSKTYPSPTSCNHEPDYGTMTIAEIRSDQGYPVLDVNCKSCGMSGSFIADNEINWD